jgi:hypothetical protein
MRQELLYAVIPTSGQISDAVNITNAKRVDIWVPTVTSGPTLQLYGSLDTTSANFVPVEAQLPNTGTFPVGPGSRFISTGLIGEALPPQIKARLSVPQTEPRTLVFVTKL